MRDSADSIVRHRFTALDGMRGVAALLIMASHSTTPPLAPTYYAGVDLFFMLSGFVLAHRHGEELAAGEGRRAFLTGRVIRIYPLYLVALAIGALVAIPLVVLRIWYWTPLVYAQALAAGLFLLPLPYEATYPFNLPTWSLFFELIANAVFVLTGWRARASGVIVAISLPLLVWSMMRWEDGGGSTWESLASGVPRVLFSYFAGVLLHRLWRRYGTRTHVIPAWLLLLALILLYLAPSSHPTIYFGALVFAAHPVLIWLGATARVEGASQRVMAWLGLISYGVYVLHLPILTLVEMVSRAVFFDFDTGGAMHRTSLFIVAPVTVLMAHWLTGRVDEPARRWLRRVLSARGSRAA